MRAARGFTLVELITVIVVLSIVAAIGSGFVATAIDSYQDTQQRAKLVQKGRLALEQMTRQLRIALPHSLRVSTSGNCIEFMPIAGGANYLKPVPDMTNMASTTGSDSIETSPVSLGLGTPVRVAIGALASTELYTTTALSSIADFAGTTMGSPSYVNLTTEHRFIRNSVNKRLYIIDNPIRFCVAGNDLVQYVNYGLPTTALDDNNPGGTMIMVVSNVTVPTGKQAFVLSGGSEDRNTAVRINLGFHQQGSSVELTHQVLVRNVP